MNDEFTRLGNNSVSSSQGFTVKIVPPGSVLYWDDSGELTIKAELFVNPFTWMLYRPKSEVERVDAVVPDVLRAIEFLGKRAEVWDYNDLSSRDSFSPGTP